MAHDEPQAAGPTKLVIRNIGLVLSGAMEKPILDADTIVADNGKITAIGKVAVRRTSAQCPARIPSAPGLGRLRFA